MLPISRAMAFEGSQASLANRYPARSQWAHLADATAGGKI